MADAPKLSQAHPQIRDPDTAPFIYFDGVSTHGIMNGAVQIEVVSRILRPLEDGGVSVEFITTGRLRCAPDAARHLRGAIDKSLDMLSNPQQGQQAARTTLN